MPRSPPRGHPSVKRLWIRRAMWTVIGLTGVALLIAASLALSLDGIARRLIRTSLERQTGVGVRLDAVALGLRDGSFHLRSLVLSNPPGFAPGPLLSVPELYLRYDAEAAASNIFRLAEARLHLDEINLRVNQDGETNLVALAGSTAITPDELSTNLLRGLQFGGVDRLTLTLGRISFQDERDERRSVGFDLGITNRTLTNVTSVIQLLPLVLEIALRGGGQLGLPLPGSGGNPPPAR